MSDAASPSPVQAALHEMRTAAAAAGIGPGEPMACFIEATSLVALSIEHASSIYGERAVEAARAARAATEAQFATIRSQVASVTAETTSSISAGIRADVVRELQAWTRRLDRSAASKAALVLATVAFATGGAAYVAGREAGRDEAVAASVGLQAILAGEPEQSLVWLRLVKLNDIVFAVAHCTPIKASDGRACMVPLRLTWAAGRPNQ